MSRSEYDPCLVTAPFVYKIEGKDAKHPYTNYPFKRADTQHWNPETKSFETK